MKKAKRVSFASLEAQFANAEGKIRGKNTGGYDIDAASLRPGRAKGTDGTGYTEVKSFAGKSKAKWEEHDEGWEFVEEAMDD